MSGAHQNRISSDLNSFRNGDEQVFEQIFNCNYEKIVGFCIQFIPDKDEAKNIAQQAFIKLWLNRSKVQTISGIQAFLYTAAKSECLNFLRHERYKFDYQQNVIQEKEKKLNQEILESFQFDKLEYKELEEMIHSALNKLPEKCRMVFEKSRFECKKNREVAEELGIAVKSVEANITRALKILRKELKHILPHIIWLF